MVMRQGHRSNEMGRRPAESETGAERPRVYGSACTILRAQHKECTRMLEVLSCNVSSPFE